MSLILAAGGVQSGNCCDSSGHVFRARGWEGAIPLTDKIVIVPGWRAFVGAPASEWGATVAAVRGQRHEMQVIY